MNRIYESEYEITSLFNGSKTYKYRGDWYHLDMDAAAYRSFRFRQFFYAAASLLLTGGAGFISSRSMYFFLPFLTYIISIPLLLVLLIQCAFCPRKPEPMEHMTYDHQYGRQKLFCILSGAAVLLALITGIVSLILDPEPLSRSSCLHCFTLLLALAALLRLFFIFRGLKVLRSKTKDAA